MNQLIVSRRQPLPKKIVCELFSSKLHVIIPPESIDTAHRVGQRFKGKQTILIRLFRRENVDLLLSKRKLLAGQNLSINEDVTWLNLQLINQIKQSELTIKQWYSRGKVWGLTKNGIKVSFDLHDNIAENIKIATEKFH